MVNFHETVVRISNNTGLSIKDVETLLSDFIDNGFEDYVANSMD